MMGKCGALQPLPFCLQKLDCASAKVAIFHSLISLFRVSSKDYKDPLSLSFFNPEISQVSATKIPISRDFLLLFCFVFLLWWWFPGKCVQIYKQWLPFLILSFSLLLLLVISHFTDASTGAFQTSGLDKEESWNSWPSSPPAPTLRLNNIQ